MTDSKDKPKEKAPIPPIESKETARTLDFGEHQSVKQIYIDTNKST